MARHEYTAKEIAKMDYQTRRRMFDQEERELFEKMVNVSSVEVAEKHYELVEKWRV